MKRFLVLLAVCFPMFMAAGCDDTGAPIDPGAALAEIQSTLPSDGVPTMDSVNELYEKTLTTIGSNGGSSQYVFTPEEIQGIANLGANLPLKDRWAMMRAELERRHPGVIADTLKWTFNAAGNVICNIAVVYASPNEYVAFFGTPIGATGFSGYYTEADVWDCMVVGEMYTFDPGQFEKSVYRAGQTAYLQKGTRRVFRYVDSCWMIDYARGNIITMFPFGVINPATYNTLDPKSAWEQISNYGELCIKSMFGI
jgi:C-8 sterol isomerase